MSKNRKKVFERLSYVFSVAFMLASIATGILPALPAAAHHATVSGGVVCTQDYQQLVTWTVGNSQGASQPMTVTAINRSISGIGIGTVIATSKQGTETIAGGTSGSITLTVSGSWTDGVISTNSGSVTLLGEKCSPPPPPTNTFTPTNSENTSTPTNTEGSPSATFPPTNSPENPTDTFTPSNTPVTPTDTFTFTPITSTDTFTDTPSNTPTDTYTFTPTPTDTFTPTDTLTPSNTPVTYTPTFITYTPTFTLTPTNTNTPTDTLTLTSTPTDTTTSTASITPSPTSTFTPTFTATLQLPIPGTSYCYSQTLKVFEVNIFNNGPDGYIGYSFNGGTIQSLGFLAHNAGTLVVIPSASSGTLQLYAKLLPADAWVAAGSRGLSTDSVFCKDPIILIFTCTGDSNAPSGWHVENANSYDVSFTWKIAGTSVSGGPIDIAAGDTYSFNTAYYPGEMQIYINGVLLAHTSASQCNSPTPSFTNLQLDSFCAFDSAHFNGWRVINPNSVSINYEWNIDGSGLSGVGTIPANSHFDFQTTIQGAHDTLLLYKGGVLQAASLAATDCARTTPTGPTPAGTPAATPSATVPSNGGTPILIPVTGVDDGLAGRLMPPVFFNLSLGFLGLGLVLNALNRAQEK